HDRAARVLRGIGWRAVQCQTVPDGYPSGFDRYRDLLLVEAGRVVLHDLGESSLLEVVQQAEFVAAWNDVDAAVFECRVVEVELYGNKCRPVVDEEGEVLVPGG